MAMKESGIEWVGLIPDTWSVIPNKYVMHKEKNLCEKWTGEDVMSLTMNGVIVRDLQNPTGKMPATFDGYQYIEDGDLLMCLFDIDVTPRCVGRVTHNGVTSPAYSNFKVHDNASRDYFYYYYLMVDNTKELLHLAKNLRHSFTEEQLGRLKVPMPLLSEQQAIAAYLDKTCSQIDEIIAEAKASIAEYKILKQSVIYEAVTKGIDSSPVLVESGIEWVGLIPDTWSVIPNKYVMHKEKNLCEKWTGEDVMSLTMNGVIVRDLQNPTGKMPATFDGYQYIEDGDLLMCLFDIDVTPRCVGRVTHNGVTSPAYSNFKVHDNASRDYFYYYYLMMDNTKELLHLAKNLRHSFTEEQLGHLKVPMPPSKKEQQAIADYLDHKVVELDSLIAEKESLIKDLESYKKSLIYEVVTGKRRVV